MYRFSRGRTKPQALLMLSSLMMFIVVAMNIFVYLLIPQYSIYGDQRYASIAKVCYDLVALDFFIMEFNLTFENWANIWI
jgi:hypothetical protein